MNACVAPNEWVDLVAYLSRIKGGVQSFLIPAFEVSSLNRTISARSSLLCLLGALAIAFMPTIAAAADVAAGICYRIDGGLVRLYATIENVGTQDITQGGRYSVQAVEGSLFERVDGTLATPPHWQLSPGEGYTSARSVELPFSHLNTYRSFGATVSVAQDTNPTNDIYTAFQNGVSGQELERLQPQFKCPSFGNWKRSDVTPWQGPSGGRGGSAFLDSPMPDGDHTRVSEVRLCGGVYIDSVLIVHKLRQGAPAGFTVPAYLRHGGPGGQCQTFSIGPSDFVNRIDGEYGRFVTKLCVYTNTQGQVGCIGAGGGGGTFQYIAPPGMEISGFGGKAGIYVDAIGVIFRR